MSLGSMSLGSVRREPQKTNEIKIKNIILSSLGRGGRRRRVEFLVVETDAGAGAAALDLLNLPHVVSLENKSS